MKTKFIIFIFIGIISIGSSFVQTKQCVITGITIDKMSTKDYSGGEWDIYSDPDVYFTISTQSEVILSKEKSEIKENMDIGALPIKFTKNYPITLPYINQKYSIKCWDDDGDVNPDDLIGEYSFVPKDYSETMPDSVVFNNKADVKVSITLRLEWE